MKIYPYIVEKPGLPNSGDEGLSFTFIEEDVVIIIDYIAEEIRVCWKREHPELIWHWIAKPFEMLNGDRYDSIDGYKFAHPQHRRKSVHVKFDKESEMFTFNDQEYTLKALRIQTDNLKAQQHDIRTIQHN